MNKISIVMSVYNGQNYIKLAMESILKQTYSDFKFIIINDVSTDNTTKIIKSFYDKRIILINNKYQMGVAKSLNIGLKNVKSEFVVRMDADDVSELNRIKIQLNYLLNHSDVGIVASNVHLINEHGENIGVRSYSLFEECVNKKLVNRNVVIHPTVMMRSSLIKKLGIYDENLNGAEDYDLWLRMAKHTKIVNLPQKLLKYRIHKESVSSYAIKRVEKATIKAQIKALTRYKYNIFIILYIIRNIASFILPYSLKRKIYVTFSTY